MTRNRDCVTKNTSRRAEASRLVRCEHICGSTFFTPRSNANSHRRYIRPGNRAWLANQAISKESMSSTWRRADRVFSPLVDKATASRKPRPPPNMPCIVEKWQCSRQRGHHKPASPSKLRRAARMSEQEGNFGEGQRQSCARSVSR